MCPNRRFPNSGNYRATIRATAPKADEGISYGMPYYKYHGALLGFAAFKTHIGFFLGAIVSEFEDQLTGYETAKGSIRFPPEGRLPLPLIRKIIRAGMKRNEAKTAAKKKVKPGRRR
jgi:uncharacterized protein YdhG (YjbR/CyaY superfamily)